MRKTTLRTKRHQRLKSVLRATRIEKGLTQEQLSRKLGRAPNYVNKIETGERHLRYLDYLEICDQLGEDPNVVQNRILQW